MTGPTPRFHAEVFKDRRLKWRYHLRSDNGQVMAPSQGYYSKGNAKRSIRSLYGNIEILDITKAQAQERIVEHIEKTFYRKPTK